MMTDKAAILGGNLTRTKSFPLRKTMEKGEIDAVNRVMRSENLSGFIAAPGINFLGGTNVKQFESAWAKKYGFKHGICVNSWTSGLIIAVGSIGIEPGDEIICSPYTMSASATSVLFYGGIPVFADINSKTYNLDPESIESRITSRTKAIIIVHLFGRVADMDSIMKIAKNYNLKVIEDAAQAPGTFYKGSSVGAIGDIGGFSLNFHKHIHCGEGGMLVTNNDDLAQRAQLIRNHGENSADLLKKNQLINIIGGNYRLTELQAAIGVEQLKKLDKILEKRKKLADFLHNEIKEIDCLETFPPKDGIDHAYYVFPFRYKKRFSKLSRNLFVRSLNAEFINPDGWETTPMTEAYIEPLYLNPIYQNQIAIGSKGFPFNVNSNIKYDYSKGICPVAEKMYEEEILISPLVREPLEIEDMRDLIRAIKKVIKNADQIARAFPQKNNEILSPISVSSSKNVR